MEIDDEEASRKSQQHVNFFEQGKQPMKESTDLTSPSSESGLPQKMKEPGALLAPHESIIEGIIIITNLPFKVTATEVITMLGVWPKGGHNGVRLVTDRLLVVASLYAATKFFAPKVFKGGFVHCIKTIGVRMVEGTVEGRNLLCIEVDDQDAQTSSALQISVYVPGENSMVRAVEAVNITCSSALPAGYGYVIVERHSDMMDILRLTGIEMQGRKLRCTKSSRENLIRDWKITKKALAVLDKSRVVKVTHLPYELKKSELIEIIQEVDFNEDDIYWSPLRKNQTNSGRGFIILPTSEDAKKIAKVKNYRALCRTIEVIQSHPTDFKNFCRQCSLDFDENIILHDELPDNLDDMSDLNLLPEGPDSGKSAVNSSLQDPTNDVTLKSGDDTTATKNSLKPSPVSSSQKNATFPKRSERKKSVPDNKRKGPQAASRPPFKPSVFVRMHNVPDKVTTSDIRIFFEPILPAKIAQNIGYNIWDIEFYNPDDAITALRRHTLMMRKNVIYLEMLPGPPHPLPPRPITPYVPAVQFGPFSAPPFMIHHPHPIPYGHPGMIPPHPWDQTQPAPPGTASPVMEQDTPARPHWIRPPSASSSYPPGHHPDQTKNSHELNSRPTVPDPRTMPAPMSTLSSKSKKDRRQSRHYRTRRDQSSPESAPPPKKELIPVPPLPKDFTKYTLPSFNGETPVGQGLITTMQGYFCQLCNKFYSSRNSAKDVHCKSKGHYDRLKQLFQEKKRLRRIAEVEDKAERTPH